jgi:hypothetical protein
VIIFNSFINIKFNSIFKTKQEVGMKKFLVIMLALFLAIPAITYAGSVTSKWDVVIGGYVQFETGYNTQGIGAATHNAIRGGYQSNQNQLDETGNFFMSAMQTELNFLIKGPDAWGAKTMAFLAGDFTGQWAATNSGVFDMKFAFIKLDWGTSNLTIGQVPAVTATLPTWGGNTLNFSSTTPFNKGTPNTQQIMFQQKFAKNWFFNIGIQNAGTMNGGAVGNTAVDNANTSGMPFLAGDIGYTSDACGSVGPWKMYASLGGFYGKTKQQWISQAAAAGVAQRYDDKTLNAWLVEAKVVIPIIPQKKENKAGGFLAAISAFTAQNTGNQLNFAPGTGGFSYTYGVATARDVAAPTITGGYAHLQYWFTNQVFVNGFYGYYSQNWSQNEANVLTAAGNNAIRNNQQITANIMYDVSPALRVGFEYINTYTRYASLSQIGATGQYLDSKGTNNSFRIGAIYFF